MMDRESYSHGEDRGRPKPPRFVLRDFASLRLSGGIRQLVKRLIPREGLIVVWGPPKCGKSFLIFDLMMHVALGWMYRGRKVQQGTVVYCALEGQAGFEARIEAFRQHRLAEGGADVPFYLMTTPLALAADADELIAAIRQQIGEGPIPAAVVLDTLNRSFVGSENDDKDMNAYIRAAEKVRIAFGCAVIVIHHSGVAGDRPRGHTSLGGAVDAQLAVRKTADGLISMTTEWMKDGPEGEVIACRLESVDVGLDEDGDTITSCVIQAVDETPDRASTGKGLTRRNHLSLNALREVVAEKGKKPPAGMKLPAEIRCVPVEDWREELFTRGVLDRQAPGNRTDFRRVKLGLMERGAVAERNDLIWIVP